MLTKKQTGARRIIMGGSAVVGEEQVGSKEVVCIRGGRRYTATKLHFWGRMDIYLEGASREKADGCPSYGHGRQ
jgi:hypothetical protein